MIKTEIIGRVKCQFKIHTWTPKLVDIAYADAQYKILRCKYCTQHRFYNSETDRSYDYDNPYAEN